MSERVKLVKGQPAWVYLPDHNGNLSLGKVLEVLNLEGYRHEYYVIEIPTLVDPILVIRSGMEVSDALHKEIGLWRGRPGLSTKKESGDKAADSL